MSEVQTYLNYIDGRWQPSCTGKTITLINPANQEVIGYAQQSNESDMELAIAAANQCFASTNWRHNAALRCQALTELARKLAEKKEALARLFTLNNGKNIKEARNELGICIDMIQYTAGMAKNIYGRVIEPAENSLSVITREPFGVVGIICPWNWPVLLMFREMIPALAAGNTIVCKPASVTAAISMEVIKVLAAVDEFPKGTINVVTGPGPLVGEVIARSDKVNMISFTGDNKTGQRIGELAAKTIKKLGLELGGKSPNVLFEDADLDKAIPTAVRAAFLNSGQVCFAGTRLVVQDTIYDKVIERLKAETEQLKVGNGLDESCNLGPLTSKDQLDKVLQYIELGKTEGKLLTGGYRLTGKEYDQGFFVVPTIFTDLPEKSPLVQEEIFGPVLVVQKFHTEAEAIQIANGTKYGLAAAVWTQDVNRALRVSRAIVAGTVWVNTYYKLYNQAEFGGSKASGIGRTRGIDGLHEFSQIKHINFDIAPNC